MPQLARTPILHYSCPKTLLSWHRCKSMWFLIPDEGHLNRAISNLKEIRRSEDNPLAAALQRAMQMTFTTNCLIAEPVLRTMISPAATQQMHVISTPPGINHSRYGCGCGQLSAGGELIKLSQMVYRSPSAIVGPPWHESLSTLSPELPFYRNCSSGIWRW